MDVKAIANQFYGTPLQRTHAAMNILLNIQMPGDAGPDLLSNAPNARGFPEGRWVTLDLTDTKIPPLAVD